MKYIEENNRKYFEFFSVGEFVKYVMETKYDKSRPAFLMASNTGDFKFTGTESFGEAADLMRNGWTSKAVELNEKLKEENVLRDIGNEYKQLFDVQGFQCSVPRYLQGVPTNMISKKKVPIKQKIVTITKSISYPSRISKNTIEKECITTLALVKKLEAKGMRVNVNIMLASETNVDRKKEQIYVKVRVKSANERLNPIKMAFPMVHPSMLRRMFFRFIEVCPEVSVNFLKDGYGTPVDDDEVRQMYCEGETYIKTCFGIFEEKKIKTNLGLTDN